MLKLFLLAAIAADVFSVVLSADYPPPCSDEEPEDCDEGYTRADDGSCFYICTDDQCAPECKDNEVYSDCINGGCDPRNCSQLGYPVPCVDVCPDDCIKGCVCASGYLRAKNGTCIPVKECPCCEGDPNAESGCGVFCDTCAGPIPCPKICKPNACQCKKGYKYDQNTKKCVLPKNCTPTCKVNEVYSDCINGGCDAQNCSQLGYPVPCVKIRPEDCIKGCICASGYLRAKNGTCIPKKECPCCRGDPNAESGCGVFCNTCAGPVPCPKICKVNACQCKKGHIYDQNTKKCVVPKDCTPTCKKNEVYSDCINGGCDARNCSQLGYPVPCVKLRPEACIKGCVCASGYLRAKNGTCIPIKECPCCGGDPHAESGCGTFCENCSNYGKGPIACPAICQINGCQCKPGYIYDRNIKKCVLPKQCTPTCKANEVYSDCINGGCDPRNCSQLGYPVPCVKLRPEDCIKGCVCAPDYLRAKNGTCVPVKECPCCGGDPCAESGCGTFCNRCSGPIPCPKICKPNACQCKKGHIYDQNTGKCVLPKQCTQTCKAHEVYSDCINGGCQVRNCSQFGKPVSQPCVLIAKGACIKGCVCESGYLRSENGTCIPEDQCPKCKPGEVYSKCANGICPPQTCSWYGRPPPLCSPINPDACKPGCICASKYLKNKDNVCIPQDQCPEAQCKKNEVYHECANGICPPQTCNWYGKPPPPCAPMDPDACKPGCICASKHLKNMDNVCIPEDQCPEAQCKKNEIYSECANAPGLIQNCSQYGQEFDSGPLSKPKNCKPACICKDGYLRNKKGDCIPKDQCPVKCKSGEVYHECANGICPPQICSRYGRPQPPCAPMNPDACKPGCICASKHLKNKDNVCIPEDQCPEAQCKKNEVYSECANGVCQLQNCSQYGQPIPFCPAFNPDKCKPGCICASKSLRNKDNVCIPKDQCPEAQCKKNEVYHECANGICPPQTCSWYGRPRPVCAPMNPDACKPGCICASKHLKNKDNICIPEDQCPEAQCKKNEVYHECANGICPPQTCSWYGKPPPPCAPFPPDMCKPGCICASKHLKNKDNVCIPEDQCPEAQCKKNEVYHECANGICPPQTCSWYGRPRPVCAPMDPDACKPGCICASKHLKNKDNVCIPEDQCPEAQCKKNEVYHECANGICPPQTCSWYGRPRPVCAPMDPDACKPGCICASKHLKNIDNVCIPEDQCPEAKTTTTTTTTTTETPDCVLEPPDCY